MERQAIATIFTDEQLIDDLMSLKESYFTDNVALSAYKWLKERYINNKRISQVMMIKESKIDVEKLIEYGTREYDYHDVLHILAKLEKRRWLMKTARKIAELAKNEELEVEQYDHKAQDIVFSQQADISQNSKIFDMQQTLDVAFDSMAAIANGEKASDGIATGYPSIDKILGGIYRGNLIVVAAPTSMGKSAFALNVAYHMLQNNKKVIYLSLEMPVLDMAKRLIALDSKVPMSRYSRKLKQYEKDNVDLAFSRLMDKHWRLCTERSLDTTDIKAICRKLTRKMEGVDLIVVDYLQNIKDPEGKMNTAKKVGQKCKEIFNMAGELDCPVMLLSQVSRKRDGVPKLSDLRDSGEIEETANDIWFPYRPEYEKEVKNVDEKEDAKLFIAKNRNGKTGVIDLVWYPQIVYFRDGFIERNEGRLELIV